VTIGWGPLPDGVNAEFSRRARRITIADRHRDEPAFVLAPLLAHELVHALDQDGTGTPADCLNDEVAAFADQASAWAAVPRATPAEPATSALAQYHQANFQAWANDTLGHIVLTTPGYQVQCSGGTVSAG
jgi:hypothetical protein